MAFSFSATVGAAEVTGSSSAVYAVTVRTNLAAYREHGEGLPALEEALSGELEEDAVDDFKLATMPERTFTVKRSYSAFRELRDSLSKNTRLAGSSLLPELPGRSLFASSAAELVLRQRSFSSLLDYLGLNEELAAADATCAFFSDVPAPNLHAVHLECVGEARAALAIDTWALQYSKNGIEIAVHALPTSNLHLIKTKLTVPLSAERTHAHYTHTANWKRFTPDAAFTAVEPGIMHVRYNVPVISARDVVIYQSQLSREEIGTIMPAGASAPLAAAVARSVLHPLCPTRRNAVRAQLLIAVTSFFDNGDGTTSIVSIQHADPRGIIPAAVVNKALVRGKEQLKEMRRVMLELG